MSSVGKKGRPRIGDGDCTLMITTIEGIPNRLLHPVQKSWIELKVRQCGYCQAGQIMLANALLKYTAQPGDQNIDEQMAGNICRCVTYQRIRASIKAAAPRGNDNLDQIGLL
jgi:aerobic-type carbon monoxide dehydrogenase small subunit (CoxS/CutS family)